VSRFSGGNRANKKKTAPFEIRREKMTLQQLKYVVAVAETGTITEAADRLYLSQPSLTNAIHELEKEMNLQIFNRTNKGISLSKEGEDFLGYARQVLEQAAILEDKYKGSEGGKVQFCVSTQHYSFAVNAFVDLVKKYGQDEYDFSLRETQTYEIIEDVARMRSEIGILFLNDFNKTVINKILKSHDLKFHPLFVAKPHVFISRKHPLANQTVITNEQLMPYPYLSFEQGEHNSFYFSEEIFSASERKKNIRVRDRATLFNLLIGLNGYTVCSGVIDKKLNGKDIIAVPLAEESDMHIGYITHSKGMISRLGNTYLKALEKYVNVEQPQEK
jgi:DNA-binding transcriptional LysR family regulator